MNQILLETRTFWLSSGEEIMTLTFFVLIQYRSVTDGRTDGQTDIPPLAIPAVCIARYANALVKNLDRLDRPTVCRPLMFDYILLLNRTQNSKVQ